MKTRTVAAFACTLPALLLLPIVSHAAKPQPFLLPGSPALVKDLNGALSGNPVYIFSTRGSTYFMANDGFNGSELWVTDGSAAGTTFVKDMTPGTGSSSLNPATPVALGDVVIFQANSAGVNQVWRTDGTPAGTYAVMSNITSGYSDHATLNGVAYFSYAQSVTLGVELWRSDGTVAGTYLVKDLLPSTNASGALSEPLVVNGTLYFPGFDGTHGGLWKSDGTGAGTVPVKVIFTGADAGIQLLTEALGRMFFRASDGINGTEPWVSDGTAAGTFMLRNIHTTDATGSFPYGFTEMNGHVYFPATSAGEGEELWRTDGTSAGTVLVKDIWPGATGSAPRNLHAVGNRLVFSANDGTSGEEPWVSDGTAAGTMRLADVNPGATGGFAGDVGVAGSFWYFNGNNGTSGIELYRTDGLTVTAFGDSNPGAASSSARPIFQYPIGQGSGNFVLSVNGLPVFRGTTAAGGAELFYVNSAGTITSLGEIAAGALSSTPQYGTVANGVLLFDADDGINGRELWKLPPVNPDAQKISVTANGKSDVLYQHTDGRIYGWAVNGGTLLANSPLTALGSSYRVKGVGDFNGAGPDGVVLRDADGNNRIVRFGAAGNSMTVLGQNDIVPAGLNWEIVAVSDFDGDGKDDILWREVGGYNFMYYGFNATTSAVSQSAVTGLGIDWKVAGVADFDGDGKADIFWRNINGANAIWLMNGPVVKQVVNVPGLGNDWSVAGIADFNRNGKPDILWRNVAGYNGIWFMNKVAIDYVVNVPGVTPDWRIVGTGDYNGDGFADILWEQTINGTRVVWLMNAGVYQGEAVLPGTGDNIAWQVVNPVSLR